DGSQRVVISVDQYRSPQDASSAYQQAFQASQEVPGARGEPVADLGQRAFIGVATQGSETHVGGGALYGDRIVTVTLQGYDGTTENRAKVTALIRKQATPSGPRRGTAPNNGRGPRAFTEVSCGTPPSQRHAVPVPVWTRTTKEKSGGSGSTTLAAVRSAQVCRPLFSCGPVP